MNRPRYNRLSLVVNERKTSLHQAKASQLTIAFSLMSVFSWPVRKQLKSLYKWLLQTSSTQFQHETYSPSTIPAGHGHAGARQLSHWHEKTET